MTPAIVYIRFSTAKQEHGDSRERQQLAAREFCQRHGLEIVEWAEDLGVSAYKGDHLHTGELGKLSQRITAGEVPPGTTLVVEQLDRLSRQGHRKALRWMEDVCERGLRIGVVVGDKFYDEQSLRDNMLDTIEILMKAKLAHDESLHKGRRVGEAWKRKIEATQRGEVLTRGCPGWLVPVGVGRGVDGTAFKIDPKRGEAIKRIFELSAEGTGISTIAKRMNESGYKAWGRSGGGWTPTHLRRLLEGPAVEGDFIPYENNRSKPNGERVVGYYPRLIDADLVARARAGLMSRRGTGGRHRNLFSNLFVGRVVCRTCAGKMTLARGGMNAERKRIGPGYLRCINASLGRAGCHNKSLFRYADFEAAALGQMLHLALDDRFFQKPDDAAAASLAAAGAAKLVADLEERMANLLTLAERARDPELVLARVDALMLERDSAKDALRAAEEALTTARGATSAGEHLARVVNVYDALQSDDDEERTSARQRVTDAMMGVVEMVICDPSDTYRGEPEKTLTLVLVGGVQALKFSDKGDLLAASSYPLEQIVAGDEAMRDGVLSGAQRTGAQLDAVLQRQGGQRGSK